MGYLFYCSRARYLLPRGRKHSRYSHLPMKFRRRHLPFTLLGTVFALACASQPAAQAQTIDWTTANYTAGSLNQNIAVGGNNALFAFSGNTGQFGTAPGAGGGLSPVIGTNTGNVNYADGGLTGKNALQLYVDFAANTQAITLTVTFQTPVPLVRFSLFDVDVGVGTAAGGVTTYTFLDQVSNIVASANGTTYGINPTLTAAANTTISGTNSAYGNAASGNGTGNANLNVSFANPAGIKSFQITYGSHVDASGTAGSTTTQADPVAQLISIGNIVIPEPGSVAICAVGVAALAALRLRRRIA